MKGILPILHYLKRHTRLIVVYFLCNILFNLFSLVSLTMLIPFLGLLFGKTQLITVKPVPEFSASGIANSFNYYLSQIIMEHGKLPALGFICSVVVFAVFLKNVFYYLALYINSPVRNAIVNDMRSDLFYKILRLPIGFFTEERKGDIMSRMTNDLQEVENSIANVLETIFREPFTILMFLGTMVVLSPELTLFLLVFLPLTGLIIGRIGRSLRKHSDAGQGKLGILLSIMEETISGMRIIKAFNAEKQQEEKFTQENNDLFRIKNKINHRRDLASPVSEFLGVVVLCIVLYFGGQLALAPHARITPETFIGFIAIFTQIINPLKSFSTAAYNIQKGRASLDRIQQVLDAPEVVVEIEKPVALRCFQRSIEFQAVSFAYNEKTVLQNINLTIEKGKMIALVGSSGAGKSTLADLIPRFHDVSSGAILLDGINIKNYKLQDLRSLMGIVTQEPILFNDTIFNNIALSNPAATQEQVVAAAKVANAHEFICKKAGGYNANIGDRGTKLSGGERQRLTIARAVLKNPPILILDEATSSLDTESERMVQEAINNLMQNRTSIVIAHRLSTIQHADEIIVLHQGQIAERGRHTELIAQNGIYKRLVEMQEFK